MMNTDKIQKLTEVMEVRRHVIAPACARALRNAAVTTGTAELHYACSCNTCASLGGCIYTAPPRSRT